MCLERLGAKTANIIQFIKGINMSSKESLNDIERLKLKEQIPSVIYFNNLSIPSIENYLSMNDISELRKIAMNGGISIKEKINRMNAIMNARGFKKFAGGTNRVVYRYLEDDRFVVKIAADRVGMKDNPNEFNNQFFLKPFVAKTFYVSACGTVGFAERVNPLMTTSDFEYNSDEIFDIITKFFIGEYALEDFGSQYFKNWGVREDFGPVLLDYPYLYRLNGKKLFCNNIVNGEVCDGEICYTNGFNHFICPKCKRVYMAHELGDDVTNVNQGNIILKKQNSIKVNLMQGDKIIFKNYETSDIISKPSVKSKYNFKFSLTNPDKPNN